MKRILINDPFIRQVLVKTAHFEDESHDERYVSYDDLVYKVIEWKGIGELEMLCDEVIPFLISEIEREKRKEAVEQSGSPQSERMSKKSKKSVKPERLKRAAIALLLVCEETVLLKSEPCVNGILKLKTNLFFLY